MSRYIKADDLLLQLQDEMSCAPETKAYNKGLELYEKLSTKTTKRKKTIFLSYSGAATEHASIVKKALLKNYKIDEYQYPNGQLIIDEVIKKIKGSNNFIGIWHHEKKDTEMVSPWMPFEWGIARSLGKKWIIVCSAELGSKIAKRIDGGNSIPTYEDLTFHKETVEMIKKCCRDKFI